MPPFWGKKLPFCQKVKKKQKQQKKTLSRTIFREAFFVTPLFLDICIEVFGAWVNLKNIFDSDIFNPGKAFPGLLV